MKDAVRRANAEVGRPPVEALLANPEAFLLRTDLARLGLPRKAVDAIFRAVPAVALPHYSRPMIRVSDYIAYVESHTYSNAEARVRPCSR